MQFKTEQRLWKSRNRMIRQVEEEMTKILPEWLMKSHPLIVKMIMRVDCTPQYGGKRTKYEVFLFRWKKLWEFVLFNPHQ